MTHPDSNSSARSTPDDGARDNPLGIAGLEFVSFSSPDPAGLATLFGRLGFVPVARHVSKAVTLYRQGSMNFLINAEPDSFASRFAETHGVGICAIGIRVVECADGARRASAAGAWDFEGEKIEPTDWRFRRDAGHRGLARFLVEITGRASTPAGGSEASIYDVSFRPIEGASAPGSGTGTGLLEVDHFTQTVGAGRIVEWLEFYREVLHFEEIHLQVTSGLARLAGLGGDGVAVRHDPHPGL